MNTVSIFVISSEHNPVSLFANGVSASVPVGKDMELDERLMPLLRDTPSVRWRYTGAIPDDLAEQAEPEFFDALAVVDGTVEQVEERLVDLTAEQLLSVRAAEEARDGATRKGVLAAINRAFDVLNEDQSQ